MAQITVSIRIDGIVFVIGVIKDIIEKSEFKEDVSDDYKNGVYDFSNAVIKTLEALKDDDYVQHGYWIDRGAEKGYFCSVCGWGCLLDFESDYHKSDFCPCCGSRMDSDTNA